MQNKRLYNVHVMHTAAALLEAHESTRAFPRPPLMRDVERFVASLRLVP